MIGDGKSIWRLTNSHRGLKLMTNLPLKPKSRLSVYRDKPDRPFRCLASCYRRTLMHVYVANIEQICRRSVEEKRNDIVKYREDKAGWSSFRAFWIAIDQSARKDMCREKVDFILRAIVKQFFRENDVTCTLLMESWYSGLRALEV